MAILETAYLDLYALVWVEILGTTLDLIRSEQS